MQSVHVRISGSLVSLSVVFVLSPRLGAICRASAMLDLSRATIMVRSGTVPPAERTAARVLVEEIRKRTGLSWPISTTWPARGSVIAISSVGETRWSKAMPRREGPDLPENRKEGFRLTAQREGEKNGVIWIRGADSRGVLFGVGQLLRSLEWSKHSARIQDALDVATSPAQPIRGHQLGYRETANSYDGWDDKQFEQYIRELALFGANSIEGIPFQDERKSPHMPLPRDVMNRRLSEICASYELDYWIWTPADFDLKDAAKRAARLCRKPVPGCRSATACGIIRILPTRCAVSTRPLFGTQPLRSHSAANRQIHARHSSKFSKTISAHIPLVSFPTRTVCTM